MEEVGEVQRRLDSSSCNSKHENVIWFHVSKFDAAAYIWISKYSSSVSVESGIKWENLEKLTFRLFFTHIRAGFAAVCLRFRNFDLSSYSFHHLPPFFTL